MMNLNSDRPFLVFGATGHQGGAVTRHLLSKGFSVYAVTRDPSSQKALDLSKAGAFVVQANMDDFEAVKHVMAGMYGVYSVQNYWEVGYDREVQEGINVADAAKSTGISHFIYSSVASAHRQTGLAHFESKWLVEQHIREISLPYTIIRPVFFMDNWAGMARDQILNGTLPFPLDPKTSFQQISVDDIGGFVATAAENATEWLHLELDISGDERTIIEVAEAFSQVLHRPVNYYQIPWDEWRKNAGEDYYAMCKWFQDVAYDANIPNCRTLYHNLTDFDAFLNKQEWLLTRRTEVA